MTTSLAADFPSIWSEFEWKVISNYHQNFQLFSSKKTPTAHVTVKLIAERKQEIQKEGAKEKIKERKKESKGKTVIKFDGNISVRIMIGQGKNSGALD